MHRIANLYGGTAGLAATAEGGLGRPNLKSERSLAVRAAWPGPVTVTVPHIAAQMPDVSVRVDHESV
eukprot:2875712-Rhodomonas_salina.1